MRNGPRGGDGGRDWGDIDWSNIDLSTFGRRRPGPRPAGRGPTVIVAVFAGLFLLPLIVGPIVAFLTDILWFRSVGFEDVYLRRYTAAFWAFFAFLVAFFVLAVPNLYAALRPRALAPTLRLAPFLLLPAFFFGLAGGAQWDTLLRWVHGVPFGVRDDVFGNDIGFYFFTLPVLEFVRGWLSTAVVLIALGVVALYGARGAATLSTLDLKQGDVASAARGALAIARPARVHLSVLAAMFLALVAAGYLLDRYELLLRSESGLFTGAGYTSLNARLPVLTLLAGITGIAALAALANIFARSLWVLAASIGVWVVAAILAGGIYPAVVQSVIVKPNELDLERPYLVRNIESTRAAFGLANVEETLFDVAVSPREQEARRELGDVNGVRLWDYRPLLAAYEQLQSLRQFYAFTDVDVDRYQIAGADVPVMLSARELDITRLPNEAKTWVNRHLNYTHGFGVVVTPVGAVTPEGLPRLALRDIPPQGEPAVTEPRIYYGELTDHYVIVGASQDEFDYAREGPAATTRFSGSGGVGIGGLWNRILFALRFGDGNLLVSPQIGAESRVLFHREITERQRLVAPFLTYDHDPYLVIADGKLYWINDAYTTGDRYPYSERLGALRRGAVRVGDAGMNYIRNSVKVITDAYDGSMRFYIVDETDPVVRTLREIYPGLFTDAREMPASLRTHLRYPEDLFTIQTHVFATYHMSDPDDFYNRGDAWKVANEIFRQGQAPQPIEPYYVVARLPGSDRREFVLFVPMTPAGTNRDNMIAWLAGRADGAEAGKIRVLRFPKDRTILGPLQIEARIEADATIRQLLTLLSSGQGAEVIRGNLLVLPVGDSFIYVEPLFVQASQGRIPELKRVVLATQDRIVIGDTFEQALDRLFATPPGGTPPPQGATPSPSPSPTGSPRPGASPGAPLTSAEIAALVRSASEHYRLAQEALRAGDFAAYGREIRLLEEDLARLRAATGQ